VLTRKARNGSLSYSNSHVPLFVSFDEWRWQSHVDRFFELVTYRTTFQHRCDSGLLKKERIGELKFMQLTRFACRFIHIKKFLSKKKLFVGTVYKICMLCVSLCRYDFVVKVIKNGRREVKNIWFGNNRCYMSQENVIKFSVA